MLRFGRLRLAVLLACGTALAGTELPDEVVGLSAGWLQAGAIGVLASLWQLSDSKTVALMIKFYELHLLDRLNPVEALWLAQRWLRRLPSWRADCLAAGALTAAAGSEASDVVHELTVSRDGVTTPQGDAEETSIFEENSEIAGRGRMDAATNGVLAGNDEKRTTIQQNFWEHARHWAAFVIYGA